MREFIFATFSRKLTVPSRILSRHFKIETEVEALMYQQFLPVIQERKPMMTQAHNRAETSRNQTEFSEAYAYLGERSPDQSEVFKVELAHIISTVSTVSREEVLLDRIKTIKTNPQLRAYCEAECEKLFGHADLDAITVDQFEAFDDQTGCVFFYFYCTGQAGSPEERRESAQNWKDANAGLYIKKLAEKRRAAN
ncbi:MAG: hypothetical protein RDA78_02995 [Roseibium sp.]|uniref:hypothetical protein n=1 Tax=Roseibium sp. TaxID=1936156 RepID=UPI003D9C14BD